ncbi:ATP-binding protein, partial [Chloroflexota bacterium]
DCCIILYSMTVKKDELKTKKLLIDELNSLRRRISELEQLEGRYKQAGEILHIFRINSPIGMFIIQDRKFVFTNAEFQEAIGLGGKKLKGTFPLDRVYPDDREKVRENAIMMLKGELASPYLYRIIRRDGSIRWLREGVVSIQYQDKRAVLGHSVDITDNINAEEKLRQLYESEKKLRKELEEEATKRIEFTRALVHELKTPLTPVLSSSELLVDELKEEPWLSIARNIHRGANNLNNRVDELLDLARVEIGMLQINPKAIESQAFLISIADYVEALIAKNQQKLIRDISPQLPEIWADEERLQQIVLNLLINASKFTPEGGTITLAAGIKDDSIIITVKDTGSGIPKKEQKRVFEPYQRRRSDRERLSGLGLGLYLCKYLVELHGGKIWVESCTGKGSTFAFSIPIKPAPENTGKGRKEKTNEAADN